MKATTSVIAGSIRTYTGPANVGAGIGMIQGASDGVCALPTGANQQCLGITNEADLVGKGVYGLVRNGETYAICGAAIAAPAFVKMDANGHFITSTATGDYVYGRAVSSTAASGDEFVIEICPFIR